MEVEELIRDLTARWDYDWLTADDEFAERLEAAESAHDARELIDVALAMLAARRN